MHASPTATWELRGAQAMMWGRPTNWSTASLTEEGSQEKAREVVGLLGDLATEYDLNRILSPTVSDFNSRFLNDAEQYPRQLTLPGTACKLHRGLRGDGFEIHPGDAGIVAPADCAVVVVTTASGRVFMLHAGRDSLVDRQLLNGDVASKPDASIIFATWKQLNQKERQTSEWHILPSISAGAHFEHRFDHPKRGESNEHLVAHLLKRYSHACVQGHPSRGRISIPDVIAAQLAQECGADPDQITVDTRCTYREKSSDGTYVWHSNARSVRTGGDHLARNLVVVMNTKK